MSVYSEKGRPYRAFRLLVLQTYGPVCWRCWRPINVRLPARHPWSFSVDHDPPLSRGGVRLDIRKARPMHYRCNSSKGNRAGGDRAASGQRGRRSAHVSHRW